MFLLFKTTKSYQNVMNKDRAIFPEVCINIMIFVLELKHHEGKRSQVATSGNLALIMIFFNLLR